MEELLSATSAQTAGQGLPDWVIDRAAAYMIRRYGRVALSRAASRRRVLLREGDAVAATHWTRVAEAIADRQKKSRD